MKWLIIFAEELWARLQRLFPNGKRLLLVISFGSTLTGPISTLALHNPEHQGPLSGLHLEKKSLPLEMSYLQYFLKMTLFPTVKVLGISRSDTFGGLVTVSLQMTMFSTIEVPGILMISYKLLICP